jgi:hypothetical protein
VHGAPCAKTSGFSLSRHGIEMVFDINDFRLCFDPYRVHLLSELSYSGGPITFEIVKDDDRRGVYQLL